MRILAAFEAANNASREEPHVELQPERLPAVRRKSSKLLEFESIETVPNTTITNAIVASLIAYGSMPVDDLAAAVAKRLGFKRTGPKIRERVMESVNKLVTEETLAVGEDDRVRLSNPPRP